MDPVCSPEGPTAAEKQEELWQRNQQQQAHSDDKPLEDDPVGNGIVGALGGGVAGFFRGGLSGAASLAMKGSGLVGKVLKGLWNLPTSGSGGSAEGPGSASSS